MKNTLSPILLVSILFLCFPSFSQNLQWSFRADIGMSKIPYFNDQGNEVSFTNLVEQKSKGAFSWSYGTKIEKRISNNFYFSTGLSYTLLKDREVSSFSLFIQNSPTSPIIEFEELNSIERVTIIKSSNLSIPISLKYKPKKAGIFLGFQANYNPKTEMTIRQYLKNPDPNFNFQDSESTFPLSIRSLDWGGLGGMSYDLCKSLSIQTEVYWGIRNIEKNFSDTFRRVNRNFTIGLSYHFS